MCGKISTLGISGIWVKYQIKIRYKCNKKLFVSFLMINTLSNLKWKTRHLHNKTECSWSKYQLKLYKNNKNLQRWYKNGIRINLCWFGSITFQIVLTLSHIFDIMLPLLYFFILLRGYSSFFTFPISFIRSSSLNVH